MLLMASNEALRGPELQGMMTIDHKGHIKNKHSFFLDNMGHGGPFTTGTKMNGNNFKTSVMPGAFTPNDPMTNQIQTF